MDFVLGAWDLTKCSFREPIGQRACLGSRGEVKKDGEEWSLDVGRIEEAEQEAEEAESETFMKTGEPAGCLDAGGRAAGREVGRAPFRSRP